jgi:hypothetical protein
MSKTLTKQWCDGELKSGYYYVSLYQYEGEDEADRGFEDIAFYNSNTERFEYESCYDGVEYVLAPVPSYDEVKEMSQKIERLEFDNEALEMAHNEGKEINAELVSKTDKLEKKLEIATQALKEINKNYRFTVSQDVVYKALKEMKGVK